MESFHSNVLPLAEMKTRAHWRHCQEFGYPWVAIVAGAEWRLRLNDRPEDPIYTLLIDGREAGGVEEWPEAWTRAR